MNDATKPIIQVSNISKGFPGVQALNRVSFQVNQAEIMALVGENGAGKSTMIKILSGAYHPDEGEIFLSGEKIEIPNPMFAIDKGISTIYQETALVQDLSIAENIFLGRQPRTKFGIAWKTMRDEAQRILNDLSLDLDPRTVVSKLSAGKQQFVEIAKALSIKANLIILDEPTSSMVEEDADTLFSVLRRIKEQGTSAIYISHKLDEVFKISERIIVLRDGNLVHTCDDISTIDEETLTRHMFGRDVDRIFSEEIYGYKDTEVLRVEGFSREGNYRDISFQLNEGQILGFFGLVGAGRTELMRGIYGLDKIDSGSVFVHGQKVSIENTNDAIRHGFAFVSEDRRLESIIQEFSIVENTTLLILDKLKNKLGLIDRNREKSITDRFVERLSIKLATVFQHVRNLSGGNQQKVALAKCLASDPTILILDEPTKGIDVHAKTEIHRLIKEMAGMGVSIIVVSSELPEILHMSHKVVVIKEGIKISEFEGKDISEENIMNTLMERKQAML